MLARVCDALPLGFEPSGLGIERPLNGANGAAGDAKPAGSASVTRASPNYCVTLLNN